MLGDPLKRIGAAHFALTPPPQIRATNTLRADTSAQASSLATPTAAKPERAPKERRSSNSAPVSALPGVVSLPSQRKKEKDGRKGDQERKTSRSTAGNLKTRASLSQPLNYPQKKAHTDSRPTKTNKQRTPTAPRKQLSKRPLSTTAGRLTSRSNAHQPEKKSDKHTRTPRKK